MPENFVDNCYNIDNNFIVEDLALAIESIFEDLYIVNNKDNFLVKFDYLVEVLSFFLENTNSYLISGLLEKVRCSTIEKVRLHVEKKYKYFVQDKMGLTDVDLITTNAVLRVLHYHLCIIVRKSYFSALHLRPIEGGLKFKILKNVHTVYCFLGDLFFVSSSMVKFEKGKN
jgi:hypothetical protein